MRFKWSSLVATLHSAKRLGMQSQVVFYSYYCGKQAYEVDDAVRTLSIALVTPILGIAVDGLAAELLQHGPSSENLSR